MNRSLTIKAPIAISKDWSFFFTMTCMGVIFVGELKLIHDCILQALKMLGHGFYCQVSIRSGIAKPSDVLERCYHCLYLLIVVLVPPVYLQ